MSKTITISDEAYRRLRRRKNEGESFSDVILDMVPDPVESGAQFVNRLMEAKTKVKREGKAT